MYTIGYDIGSSSIKIALVASKTGKRVALIQEPEGEMQIEAPQKDWAEQDPNVWWAFICSGTKRILNEFDIASSKITGVGISYQMHGLVLVDEHLNALRNAIIWCDSRAVEIGEEALSSLGVEKCRNYLLNAPGNFTASKLKWVKENEPEVFRKIYKYMLPGDFIAMKFTHRICTTRNGLSEGILWDYKEHKVAEWVLDYFEIPIQLTPEIVTNFTSQGTITAKASEATGLPMGIPIKYRAGDQPNNALSLNVFNPGELAATGGTSGVIYAVGKQLVSNELTRINNFAHVNAAADEMNIGKLLCINGAGIQYHWLKKQCKGSSYQEMNAKALSVPVGSDGVLIIPFGNGAERMLNNRSIGTHILHLDLNRHDEAHMFRAGLEGIAFSFVYGMDILKNDGIQVKVIRAGNDNLFQSELFATTIATLTNHEIEIYDTTGAVGAARAVSITDGNFEKFGTDLAKNDHVKTYKPKQDRSAYEKAYQRWKRELEYILSK